MSHPPTINLKRLRRKAELHARTVMRADHAFPLCPIPGCGRPPQARAGRGFSLTHCRFHIQAKNRHGSFWKKTYSAATLRPYRRAAERFIKTNPQDFWIVAAQNALRNLMADSGPIERIVDVNELLSPAAKARASLARLRRAEVPPVRLLVAYLAVAGALEEDSIRPGGEPGEYRRVQAAKAVFRLASGYHAVYGPNSRYDLYPRSGGLALRHLGRMLEDVCEHVRDAHLETILELKATSRARRDAARR